MTLSIVCGLNKARLLETPPSSQSNGSSTTNQRKLCAFVTSMILDCLSVLGLILVGALGASGVIGIGSSVSYALFGLSAAIVIADIISIFTRVCEPKKN